MKIIKLEQGSSKWLKWRKSGIGGSDAPAVLSKSPYATRYELFLDKTSKKVAQADSSSEYIFQKGHEAEEKIRQEILSLTGLEMIPMCVEHKEAPYIIASLDGYHKDLGILEAKLVGKEVFEGIKKGIVPANHNIQIQHNMMVAEVDIARYFARDLKGNTIALQLQADKEYQKYLKDEETAFWELVQKKIAPELTDEDYLIPSDPTDFKKIARVKAKLDKIQAEFDALANKLKSEFSHPKVKYGQVQIFTTTRAGSIDYSNIPEIKKLEKSYLESFRKAGSTSKTLKIG